MLFQGQDVWADPARTRQTRFQVGLVFQYPEYQLFEETVYKDISFGPKNMGLGVPQLTRVFHRLRAMGADVDPSVYTLEQAKAALLDRLGRAGKGAV